MMIATVFFVVIATLIAVGVAGPAARAFQTADDSILSEQSYALAESGVEDAYYRLRQSLPVGSTNALAIGPESATTTLSTDAQGVTTISAAGNAYGDGRTVVATVERGSSKGFPYAVDAGHGGIAFTGNSQISGSAYAIGLIGSTGGAVISGSAVSASAAGPTVDQTNGSGTPAAGISFGNAAASRDFTQSFAVAGISPLSQISVYVEKTGTPADATVEAWMRFTRSPGGWVARRSRRRRACLAAAAGSAGGAPAAGPCAGRRPGRRRGRC